MHYFFRNSQIHQKIAQKNSEDGNSMMNHECNKLVNYIKSIS